MKGIVIVDYGMCNLDSVARAEEQCGGTPQFTVEVSAVANADGIVLPGVGSFADGQALLRNFLALW